MKYKIVFPIMMLAAIPLFAQQNDETDWLSQISRNNKELQSARQAMEGDILMAKSENNLADPEFEMEYGFQRPENGLELVVSESFEWPGMYVARKKHIDNGVCVPVEGFECTGGSKAIVDRTGEHQQANCPTAEDTGYGKGFAGKL